MTKDIQKELNKHRKEIDIIDNKLANLIKKRSLIANKVKVLKQDIHPKIRIAREILQAHALQKKDFGSYKHTVMQKIWREFIFSTLDIEGDLNIEVYHDNNNISPLWVLARDHFGTYSNISQTNSIKNIFENIFKNTTTLGVIPFPENMDSWWHYLTEYPDIKVCLSLPFLEVPENTKSVTGVVVSKAKIEESEQDRSIFLIEALQWQPMNNIKVIFSKNNQHLVVINGFTKDRSLISSFTGVPISQIFYLGTYPKPLQDY